ncbi:MAG: addiction module protein [Bacteroidetes bacterium]|jgi:hypothetical protein|nr:addiction module protein [Bacteroidota bacterium]
MKIKLTEEQISMLMLSDEDIRTGKLVSQELLDRDDIEWLDERQKEELDRRLFNYQNGIGKTYTWDETVVMAKQTLADRKNSQKGVK